ncbi:unnamed protein product [Rotaria sordida]|uniref:Uncharacterized protein n=1 Tax=Rotaria sordida TaxID=392033 RepID=A0A819SEB3_9BILA|nr:unnamed protein product [Rotaria sordida]CAF4060108.1 unnamed protein product [Rotaria sordida]
MGREQFQCPEALFQPLLVNVFSEDMLTLNVCGFNHILSLVMSHHYFNLSSNTYYMGKNLDTRQYEVILHKSSMSKRIRARKAFNTLF